MGMCGRWCGIRGGASSDTLILDPGATSLGQRDDRRNRRPSAAHVWEMLRLFEGIRRIAKKIVRRRLLRLGGSVTR
jgi:hypothetical protein